jgi:crossover junction endodeoxyribonuclease RuvC
MSAPLCLGVDPGISGAFALVDLAGNLHEVDDLPTRGVGARQMLNTAALAGFLRPFKIDLAVVELVGAMPKQGVSSVWKFGYACGQLEGALSGLGIPVMYVTPQAWKRSFNLPADKEAARSRAIETFPARHVEFMRKRDAGRAEAALIAMYGLPYLQARRAA